MNRPLSDVGVAHSIAMPEALFRNPARGLQHTHVSENLTTCSTGILPASAAHRAQARTRPAPSPSNSHRRRENFLHRRSSPQRSLERDSRSQRAAVKTVASIDSDTTHHCLKPQTRQPACASIALMEGAVAASERSTSLINFGFPVTRGQEVGGFEDVRRGAGLKATSTTRSFPLMMM